MLRCEQVVHDRYVVIRTLGRGGLSVVYEVADLTLPQRWALKQFVPPRLGDDELRQVREQFQREVEILSGLSHPRLPRVIDAFHWQGQDFMVMELVEGETLASRITSAREPFDETACRQWALQILEVLAYLHGQTPPVIFRDIKPENLMLDPVHGIRFIDFGIARLFNPVKEQDTVFMGTPGFAAPEQFRRRQSDPRSDLYSLGATLHYLLTLRDPALTPFALGPISLVNSNVSRLMEQVVQRALEIRPENRFQSARDVIDVLEGRASIDEVTTSTSLVVQPRELLFEDLTYRGHHERIVDVHTVGGEPEECAVSCPHDGVVIEPARFQVRQQKVRVRLLHERFPRGESVQTSLAFSIPQATITAPVTVQFRPTFVQSLPAAIIGLVVFGIAALGGMAAGAVLQGTSPEGQATWVAGLLLLSLLVLGTSLRGVITRPDALGFALLMGAALIWPVGSISAGDGQMLASSPMEVVWPGVGTLCCNALLLAFGLSLSARQRQRTRPVLLAGFFGFPVACLMLIQVPGVDVPELSQVSQILATSGLGLGLIFLGLFVWYERRLEERLLDGERIGGLAVALGALFWPVLGAAWLQLDSTLGAFAAGETAASGWGEVVAERMVQLPSVLFAESYTRIATVEGVAVLLALVTSLASLRAGARRLLEGLVPLGFIATIGLALAALTWTAVRVDGQASAALLADVERSPIPVMRKEAVRRRYPALVRYLSELNQGWQGRQNGLEAAAHFAEARAALAQHGPSPALLDVQLRFLATQSALESGGSRMASASLVEAPPSLETLSSTSIKAYAGSGRAPRPPAFFSLFTGGDALRLATDYDVAAAIRLQRYRVLQITGRGEEATVELEALRALLKAAPQPQSEALRAVGGEIALLEKSVGTPHDELLRLGRWYLDQGRGLAWPYLEAAHFEGLTLDERLRLLVLLAAHRKNDESRDVSAVRGDVDENLWQIVSGLTLAYGRQDFGRCYGLFASEGPALRAASSPFVLRVQRDCRLLRGRWQAAIASDADLRELLRSRGEPLAAADDFKAAWAHEMAGEAGAALPLYRSYLRAVGDGATDTRAKLVRARLEGGLLPSLVHVLQPRTNGVTMTIVGQGVPEELVPDILVVFSNVGHPPALRTSDNIQLVHKSGYVIPKSERAFYKVRFKDVEAERRTGRWRYWISYDFEEFVNWPSALVRQQQDIFCSLFAVDFGAQVPEESVGLFPLKKGNSWFLMASRYRFDAQATVLPNQLPVFGGYVPPLAPEEIVKRFLSEP